MTAQQGSSPKVRYFYRYPLAAAWMQEHFGIRFVSRDSGKEFEKSLPVFNAGSPVESIRKGQVYVVHRESLLLLKPRVGDVVLDDGTPCWCAASSPEDDRVVIQRDGKPFHWPESEPA